ncbi:MAG TPA: hypothetical protein VHF51_17405 [Solirubrobacteraceae bacterium]|nr:hypothetical protein [Solirubrobacteraceae bacterium]
MKVQATITLEFQARTLAEAGALLDDVLERARERDDVGVGRVEVVTPPGDSPVTLPSVTRTGFAAGTPAPGHVRNGT